MTEKLNFYSLTNKNITNALQPSPHSHTLVGKF